MGGVSGSSSRPAHGKKTSRIFNIREGLRLSIILPGRKNLGYLFLVLSPSERILKNPIAWA